MCQEPGCAQCDAHFALVFREKLMPEDSSI